MSAAGSQVSYEDLYARWERGNWRALEIDFTEDRRQWHEVLTEHERRAALWSYAMFFHGEDAVADDLAPFIAAAPREEQKYFLATQQVDEARHAIFFKRFLHEVVGRGDGSVAGGLRATEPELTWGFRKTFALLDEITGALRTDTSRVALARAVTMYHVVVEALLAQPGQHFISDYLERRDLLPGFREGMRLVALDEQRHIGFGVKLLHDLHTEDPGVRDAVADLIRRVTPYSLAVFIPPNWDRSYTECFGFTLEEIYTEGARSFEAKLRSAGLPLESLPGPSIFPLEMSAAERADYGLAMLRAGFIGPPNGAPPRDPVAMELLFTSIARAVDHRSAPAGPFTVQWEFADAESWHVRVDNGSTAAAPGRAPEIDVELRVRYEDWVDIVAQRLDARRALATGKLRAHGSPRALWAARSLF
ncbi:ribonucleotide-diphosphate reductase subunit beta [Solirubrobacter ginsenosidimutans]|uniref:Ribonucleotide-diphosphate reductase subunit beta n=1 Tax=Solirubrobacter ginsenosidimutans TaxID=490573 RepID=A0A9X3S4Q3_9ACTN|nr:ribonucleotide-diphosphate reductase subunit beta [Solirubrobacter ginsenosidimutans]MDA0163321.1 ribonucleotide-diphosphate reductase subunit beta [Solirubrobacter ginsenosidimutans]